MKLRNGICIIFTVIGMNRIKELRKDAGMSQADLAGKLAVSRQAVSNYETEIRQLEPATITALCRLFACTADYLLGLSPFRAPAVSESDAALLDAYHAADDHTRQLVDLALQPFFEQEGSSASAAE